MKAFFLSLSLLSASSVFAQEFVGCTFEQIELLRKAQGPKSEEVNDLLNQEASISSCEVQTVHYAFPMDCGRFTYVEYNYRINVFATSLTATVHDGWISCTRMKSTNLSKVKIKKN